MMQRVNRIIGEKLLFISNEHWVKYAPAFFLMMMSWFIFALCLWISTIIMNANHLTATILIIIGHTFLFLFHHVAFYMFFNATTHQTYVTNRRVLSIRQKIWKLTDMVDIPLWQIESIEVQTDSFTQEVLQYGYLILNSGALPTVERIPQPHKMHIKLMPHIQGMQPAVEKRN